MVKSKDHKFINQSFFLQKSVDGVLLEENMKKTIFVVLLLALVFSLAGCSQKKIDELTAVCNTEKESLQAQIDAVQAELQSVVEEKDGMIAEAQEALETLSEEAETQLAEAEEKHYLLKHRLRLKP